MESNVPTYKLTQPQMRIWVTQMIHPSSSMYNIGGVVMVNGFVDLDILQQSIKVFVSRHDAFSIRITMIDEQPRQYFSDKLPKDVNKIDFTNKQQCHMSFSKWVKQRAEESLFFYDDYLYEFYVYKLSDDKYGYFIKLHHIIADGWSIKILVDEIKQNYEAIVNHKNLPEHNWSKLPYKQFIHIEDENSHSDKYVAAKNFWIDEFASCQENQYLSDKLEGVRLTFHVSEEKTEKIYRFCKENDISVNALFICLYLIYLYKTSGNEDIVIGMPVLGRIGSKVRNSIGMFVNSMPFRYQVNATESILQMLHSVISKLQKYYRNQSYPYNLLIKELQMEKASLYTTCVNYYSTELSQGFHGHPVEYSEFYNGQQEYDLQIIIRDWSGGKNLQVDIDYKTEVFEETAVIDLYFRLECLMDQFFDKPEKLIQTVGLLSEEEEEKLVYRYNQTLKNYNDNLSVIDMFCRQAELTPDRIAIQYGEDSLNYAQLHERANRMCIFLQNKGVTTNMIVAIIATHSIDTVVAILGILMAGGIYVPIDPQNPTNRILYILRDTGTRLLLTNIDLPTSLEYDIDIIYLYDSEIMDTDVVSCNLSQTHLVNAYIIYTSGSTGNPKGVLVSHKNLSNYIYWAVQTYVTEEIEVFPLYSSLAFDLTMTSIFTPLSSGGKIIVYVDDQDEYIFNRIIRDDLCTTMKLTPSHLSLLADSGRYNVNLNKLIVGGENLSTELAEKVWTLFAGNLQIFNEYGPTEATVGCMVHKYSPKTDISKYVPIGKPAANTRIYVCDENMNSLPVGIVGEIYISGDGVVAGYLNQPEQTAECFVNDPFFDHSIAYKTGDMAKFILNDNIEYCARMDSQVKIKGYRIEFGEIENRMLKFDGISAAVVNECKNEDKSLYLCAYYTSDIQINEDVLERYLYAHLPNYMIPSAYVYMEKIPLTRNGKVNKAALPVPSVAVKSQQSEKPLIEEEKSFLIVFKDLLGLTRLNLSDNFFRLGGDSIKAIQASSRFNEQGYTLKVNDVLMYPVFEDMIHHLRKAPKHTVSQEICTGEIPLTPIIKWFFSMQFSHPDQYCQSVFLTLHRNLDTKNLENILMVLVGHHDILRANLDKEGNCLFYNNTYVRQDITICEYDFSHVMADNLIKEMESKRQYLIESMDICNSLLLRSCLFHTAQEDIWCIAIHHLAVDSVSWHILLDDIQKLMDQCLQKQPLQLPVKTVSYQQWAWQYKKYADEYIAYDQHPVNTCGYQSKYTIDNETTASLMKEANEPYHTQPVELLVAALLLTASEIISKKICINVETHGRHEKTYNEDISRTVGWFTSIFPIRNEFVTNVIPELIKTTKELYRDVIKRKTDTLPIVQQLDLINIRFNYMGSFNSDYKYFTLMPIFFNFDELTEDIEIDAILIEDKIKILVQARNMVLAGIHIDTLMDIYLSNVSRIVDHCIKKTGVDFTPSDFDAVSLTQEELDELFS